jgi:hypothetical protein
MGKFDVVDLVTILFIIQQFWDISNIEWWALIITFVVHFW